MKKIVKRLALFLVLAMLATGLGGCDLLFTMINMARQNEYPGGIDIPNPTITSPVTTDPVTDPQPLELEFVLTEEEIQSIDAMIDGCREISYSATATREEVEDAWDALEEKLDYVSDQVVIARVLYYMDTTNEEANQTYLDAYDDYLALGDKGNLLQKDMYEDSPVKSWFFEDWSEADIAYLKSYTSEQVEIRAELNKIETEFVEMPDESLTQDYTDAYIRMVTLGNRQAKLSGYDNYYEYMSAIAYGRDYSAEKREQFRSYVKTILAPAFEDILQSVLAGAGSLDYEGYTFFMEFPYTDYDELSYNYLEDYLNSTTGSTNEYLNHMFKSGNYIMTDDENAYEGAFTTHLDYYDTSLCYFGPGYQSTNTVAHELGHYYATFFEEDENSFDLLETHSQGNEMMLLAHIGQNPPSGYEFVKDYTLFNTVVTVVIACMVDEYEQRIYEMESVEGLTTEAITQLIIDVQDEYFGAFGGAEYVEETVTDMQYYIRKVTGLNPAYYISYATSAVTSLNLFALAREDEAAARELYRKLVEEATEIEGYEAALQAVGAASPFEESSFHTIVNLFAD